jgi:hypothetical protein
MWMIGGGSFMTRGEHHHLAGPPVDKINVSRKIISYSPSAIG